MPNVRTLTIGGVTYDLQDVVSGYAPTASPTLTGVPVAPTAASGTNTTQIATTAFVQNAINNFSNIFVVHLARGEEGIGANKTFAQVLTAIDDNQILYGYLTTITGALETLQITKRYDNTAVYFRSTSDNYVKTYTYTSSGITETSSTIGTITSITTTAGAHTTINVSSGAANFNVPTKTSHLTNDSGFITSYTETDPVFTASPAYGIIASDITNWNGKTAVSIVRW